MTFCIILLLLIIAELAYFRIADKFNIVDNTNLRSSHTRKTIRGGGIIFLVGIWLYTFFFGLNYPWFILGATLIGITSFIDDIRPLTVWSRLVVQFISVLLMFCQLGIFENQSWPLILSALIIGVGIINAYNFMDGINGMTGGYSFAVVLPLLYLNAKYSFISQQFLYIMGLSVLVFSYFNFRKKAKCFAGDVGSISIAFILFFALARLILATGDFSYLTLMAVYGVDTVLTICHRIQLHENLGKAHRKHAYQLMANELRIPHVLVSSLYMSLQLLISAGLLFIPINHYAYLCAVVAALAAAYLLFMNKNYHLHH